MRKKLFILAVLLLFGSIWQINAQSKSYDEALTRAISLYKFDHWTEARSELLSLTLQGKSRTHFCIYIAAAC